MFPIMISKFKSSHHTNPCLYNSLLC